MAMRIEEREEEEWSKWMGSRTEENYEGEQDYIFRLNYGILKVQVFSLHMLRR